MCYRSLRRRHSVPASAVLLDEATFVSPLTVATGPESPVVTCPVLSVTDGCALLPLFCSLHDEAVNDAVTATDFRNCLRPLLGAISSTMIVKTFSTLRRQPNEVLGIQQILGAPARTLQRNELVTVDQLNLRSRHVERYSRDPGCFKVPSGNGFHQVDSSWRGTHPHDIQRCRDRQLIQDELGAPKTDNASCARRILSGVSRNHRVRVLGKTRQSQERQRLTINQKVFNPRSVEFRQ